MATGNPRLLLAPTAATGSNTNQTLYTAPTNTKGIVRHITVANTTAAGVTFRLSINGTSATAANALYFDQAVAANTTTPIFCYYILKAGDTLQAAGSVAGITFTVTGDEIVQTA